MDTNLMPPPPNMMPPPTITPPKRKKQGDSETQDKPEVEKNPEVAENGEKEQEVGEKAVETAIGGEGEKEKEEKGKEKEEKGKEKWKEPENVELLYTPPEWSSAPKHKFVIDVLKNGTIVENIDLSTKEHYLIGRAPICDITFDHPSVSRQHAVIQNRDTGALYIYDLGSTHGTIVNKRPIPPKKHYVIRIGDVIKIGQSTRQFIVGGPPEVEQEQRETLERQRADFLRKKLEDQVQIKTYTPLIDLFAKKDGSSTIAAMRESASWGIDFDDDAVYAADNPEEEVFMGNEDDAEAYIKKGKKEAKKTALINKHATKRTLDDDDSDSDDDEFFDRTLHKNEGTLGKVETYESLVTKKEELTKKKEEFNIELKSVRSSGSTTNDEADPLDAFMSSNTASIEDDKRKRIQAKIAEVDKELSQVERLIKFAAPALKPVAQPKKPTAAEKSAAKLAAEKSAEKPAGEKGGLGMPSAKKETKPKRPLQILEPEIPEEYRVKEPIVEKEEEGGDEGEEGKEKGGEKGERKGEKAKAKESEEAGEGEGEGKEEEGEGKEEDGEKGKSRTAIKRERQREKQRQREEEERKRQKLMEFESKYDSWVPPAAQSGDGRTKLNDLYGY